MSGRLSRLGALGALLALPVLGACTPEELAAWRAAVAADSAVSTEWSVWDDIAECESGGDWSIDTGNGYYGGLQFAAGTWRGFGGEEFASMAHLASRTQQIEVAERVLDEQSWGAWPTCSRRLGLH